MSLDQDQNHEKTVIIICGPTASGKTAVAVELANLIKTEIINADSRQIYKELNIGVAKPSIEELTLVKHHLIGTHSVKELFGAGDFEKEALNITKKLFKKHDYIVVCGGTGMYIKAFCEGLDDLPKADEDYRTFLNDKYKSKGISYLQSELKKEDPLALKMIDINNPQRLMRALEIIKVSGKLYSQILAGKKANRDFNIVKIGLNTKREELYKRINDRVDQMMKNGLLEEVKSLKEFENYNALKTVGYTELFDYLNGKSNLAFAIDKIKQHTRNYAKRQLTWFNADKEIKWFDSNLNENLISSLNPN